MLNTLIKYLGRSLNVVSLAMISIGLLITGCLHNQPAMIAGAMLARSGIRNHATPSYMTRRQSYRPRRTATLSLSFVMSGKLSCGACMPVHSRSLRAHVPHVARQSVFPFVLNAVLTAFFAVWAYVKRDDFAMGMDESYVTDNKSRKPLTTYIPIHITTLPGEPNTESRSPVSLVSRHICFYYWTISFKINITYIVSEANTRPRVRPE